ncbi:hypothetical protein B0H19DRAFT_1231564 [Mycena capillaripes]|nr:hypothetical protein B0H19DRAFT_1231564 [Mycena capillaripes]
MLGWLATKWSVDYKVLLVLLSYRATAGILVLRQAMANPVAVCSSGVPLQIRGDDDGPEETRREEHDEDYKYRVRPVVVMIYAANKIIVRQLQTDYGTELNSKCSNDGNFEQYFGDLVGIRGAEFAEFEKFQTDS